MLSPTPLSLFCALILCLPLAIVFTITTPTTTSPTISDWKQDKVTIVLTETYISKHNHKLKIKTPISPPPPKQLSQTLPPPPPPPPPQDDDSLLHLASQVNRRPKLPEKIAFLFLATTPLPFAPLWELYFNQSRSTLFNIYVHADPTYKYDPPFTGVFTDKVIHSKPAKRQTPTLISAARRLLSHALLHDPSNSMFALLSPSCIPLHSFDFTYKILTNSRKSFIEILDNEGGAYDRWAARGYDAMLPEVRFEDFRIGSQFWVLTRKHARMVVRDRRIWPKFNQTCLREATCYPEENYFPTLVHMRDPRGSVSATLTSVDWSVRAGGHPRMYKASEVGPDLISILRDKRPRYGYEGINGSDLYVMQRNDPFLFARKFSPDSIQPLIGIAKDVILKD
ncbi:unnamed protein product [Dovyalis caffra]|uniref:Core-2/I-branching beta-1,6-N-acetylglucosaminyltransferase family protein n=1 Tax=Dovyalis caffra TaxID=77055 RepID=A0AAV1SNF2_9ROSI|nr:unnamed protein product [Dovyalis caffra]